MRITIIQGAFLPVPPVQGGAVEKIWYRMGKEFALLGHEVTHISRSYAGLPDVEELNGVIYKRIRGYNTPKLLIKLKFLDLLYSARALCLVDENTDIIITNTFWSPLLIWGNQRKKVYIDVQRVPKGQMKYYLNTGFIRGCSPIISEAIKKEIPTTAHDLVSYIPNPVPFDVKPIKFNKENTILFVGRLHPEKGVHILIKSFNEISKKLPEKWKLIIIGPHDFKDGGGGNIYLQQLINLSEERNVEFVGPVYDDNMLTSYYAKARIFCYPAQEGSGDAAPVAPREAMAYGCVPVVSKLPCFNDFITHKSNGILYDQNAKDQVHELGQSLRFLIENKEDVQILSDEAKLISQTFSAPVIAKEFIKDFEKINAARTKTSFAGVSL